MSILGLLDSASAKRYSGWQALTLPLSEKPPKPPRVPVTRFFTPLLRAAALFCLVAALAIELTIAASPATAHWRPGPRDRLHIQFTGPLEIPPWATVVEIDGQIADPAVVQGLKSRGLHVICYISAGTSEDYRPDASAFDPAVLGLPLPDWPDERWIDIRQRSSVEPIMLARIDECAGKGFDGIEFDNVDGWLNSTGFSLSRSDALSYLRWLIKTGQARGLAVGLKNSLPLVGTLAKEVDWALNEQCVQYRECGVYRPLLRLGKAVFVLEYSGSRQAVCAAARRAGVQAQVKSLDLDGTTQPCP